MAVITDTTKWQPLGRHKMGGWLSTAKLPWTGQDQTKGLDRFKTQVCSNLRLAPTLEELCSDDEDDQEDEGGKDGWNDVDSDDEDDELEESLLRSRELRRNPRDWVYDQSKTALENRRPGFFWSLFGW